MTPDEIISAIKRSSIPTICVEGIQDKTALRLVEKLVGLNGSILLCNGRTNLFKVWERRSELVGKKVAFLADRDLFVFGRVPAKYKGIIFTHGYSLENDILLTMRWRKIFTAEDSEIFDKALELSLNHYWHECKMANECGHQPVWISTWRLFEDHIKATFSVKPGSECCALYKTISSRPYRFLRGKNLLDCVHVSLSHKNRHTKFGPAQIIEISIRPSEGKYLRNILQKISNELCLSWGQ